MRPIPMALALCLLVVPARADDLVVLRAGRFVDVEKGEVRRDQV